MTVGSATIARPYAIAAFEVARERQQLPAWKSFLKAGTLLAKDKSVIHTLANPEVSSEQQYHFFCDILKSLLDEEKKNFLKLLANNKRLSTLPEISSLFDVYYDSFEKTVEANITTAAPIDATQRDNLTQALAKRLQQQVVLHCKVDPTLVGGAIIRIGDRVIDGSVRGKLSRLLEAMTS